MSLTLFQNQISNFIIQRIASAGLIIMYKVQRNLQNRVWPHRAGTPMPMDGTIPAFASSSYPLFSRTRRLVAHACRIFRKAVREPAVLSNNDKNKYDMHSWDKLLNKTSVLDICCFYKATTTCYGGIVLIT